MPVVRPQNHCACIIIHLRDIRHPNFSTAALYYVVMLCIILNHLTTLGSKVGKRDRRFAFLPLRLKRIMRTFCLYFAVLIASNEI